MNTNLAKQNRAFPASDPWRDFLNLESFFPDFSSKRAQLPAVNISEDEKSYQLDVVAPGFKKEDFKVNVEDDTLTISAETKQESSENGKQYSRREYSYNAFTRSFQLPDNTKDGEIKASYTDGVLKLTIPKSEQQTKATKEIKVG